MLPHREKEAHLSQGISRFAERKKHKIRPNLTAFCVISNLKIEYPNGRESKYKSP